MYNTSRTTKKRLKFRLENGFRCGKKLLCSVPQSRGGRAFDGRKVHKHFVFFSVWYKCDTQNTVRKYILVCSKIRLHRLQLFFNPAVLRRTTAVGDYCKNRALFEKSRKTFAPHLLQMFSCNCTTSAAAAAAQNEGEKRFFDKGSLGPGAFGAAGDHLYLFFFLCVCNVRAHIHSLQLPHFFPIPFCGRRRAVRTGTRGGTGGWWRRSISILRCYYYTTSKIPNPLKKNTHTYTHDIYISWWCVLVVWPWQPHVSRDAKQPRASPVCNGAFTYDRTLQNRLSGCGISKHLPRISIRGHPAATSLFVCM